MLVPCQLLAEVLKQIGEIEWEAKLYEERGKLKGGERE